MNEIIWWKFMLFGMKYVIAMEYHLDFYFISQIIYSKFISSTRIQPNSMNGHPSVPWLLLATNFATIRL